MEWCKGWKETIIAPLSGHYDAKLRLSSFGFQDIYLEKRYRTDFLDHMYDNTRLVLSFFSGVCLFLHVATLANHYFLGQCGVETCSAVAMMAFVSGLQQAIFFVSWSEEAKVWIARIYLCMPPCVVMPSMLLEFLFSYCSVSKVYMAFAVFGSFGMWCSHSMLPWLGCYLLVTLSPNVALLYRPDMFQHWRDHQDQLAGTSLMCLIGFASFASTVMVDRRKQWLQRTEPKILLGRGRHGVRKRHSDKGHRKTETLKPTELKDLGRKQRHALEHVTGGHPQASVPLYPVPEVESD
mmetsp:Transcript_21881/g.34290  ORF Transcript_21881/g.34290 Transcript_21881/m.34290 type:complete len:294 (+) Transcript_21881:513-1394(+)